MDPKKTSEFRFWRAIFDLSDSMREMVFIKAMKDNSDLNYRHHQIARAVYRMTEKRPEGISLKELAEAIELTPGTVSELVETLVQRDALQRVQNPSDRRGVLITLTRKSIDYLNNGVLKTNELTSKILSTLEQREREKLIEELENIEMNLKSVKDANK